MFANLKDNTRPINRGISLILKQNYSFCPFSRFRRYAPLPLYGQVVGVPGHRGGHGGALEDHEEFDSRKHSPVHQNTDGGHAKAMQTAKVIQPSMQDKKVEQWGSEI